MTGWKLGSCGTKAKGRETLLSLDNSAFVWIALANLNVFGGKPALYVVLKQPHNWAREEMHHGKMAACC